MTEGSGEDEGRKRKGVTEISDQPEKKTGVMEMSDWVTRFGQVSDAGE